MTNSAEPDAGPPRMHGANDEGYERLRTEIIEGRLMPNERLVEADLMRSLGIGRAAVRMTLVRLENDGLVVREPNRGARVRMFTEAEAVEITQARAVLEALAARQAAIHATDEDVAEMRALLSTMRERLENGDLLLYSEGNAQLHAKMIATSGHSTAARLIAELKAQLVRFQYRTILVSGRARHSLAEHTEIVEAIASHDPDRAELATKTHLAHVASTFAQTTSGLAQHGEAGAAQYHTAMSSVTSSGSHKEKS